MHTLIIIKKFHFSNIKKIFCSVNIRTINLSFDGLRLIAQVRNISGYENKSKVDLIKALSETKPETPKPKIPKPETPKLKTPKPETPKLKTPKLISSKLKISKLKHKNQNQDQK